MQSRRILMALVGAVVVACTSTVPPASQPTPSVPPGSAAPSAATTPAPQATGTQSPRPVALPLTLSIPDTAVRTLPSADPTATFGSRVFEWSSPLRGTGAVLFMGDLATGTSITLATLAKGHDVDGIAATADRVIWVEKWRDHPSPPNHVVPDCPDAGKPVRWKITAMVVATHARTAVAAGTNTRTAIDGECADVNAPEIAADGDRVAYTLEAPTPGHLAANRIVVRSLTDGKAIRRIQSQGLVRDLQLDGRAIAYRDAPAIDPGSAFVAPFDGTLMAAPDDAAAPAMVDGHVRASGLGGGRIAWIGTDATDGSIWTATLGSDIRLRLSGFVAPDFVADGATQIAVSAGLVAWVVSGKKGDINTDRLAAWLTGDPSIRYVAGFDDPDAVAIRGGWFVWDSTLSDPGTKWPAALYGLPLAMLSAR